MCRKFTIQNELERSEEEHIFEEEDVMLQWPIQEPTARLYSCYLCYYPTAKKEDSMGIKIENEVVCSYGTPINPERIRHPRTEFYWERRWFCANCGLLLTFVPETIPEVLRNWNPTHPSDEMYLFNAEYLMEGIAQDLRDVYEVDLF